jgi:hypothetical protein
MDKVHTLTESDFVFNTLKIPDCTLVLFYNDISQNDRDIYTIWQTVARSNLMFDFAAVNLRDQPNLNFFPDKIVVYRNRLPETFFRGNYKVQDITEYILSLPCDEERRRKSLTSLTSNF